METTYTFQRIERKYLVDEVTKKRLLHRIGDRLLPDAFGRSTICSVYLDTPDHRIIRNSLDAGAYKEKLRLRSYGTPGPQDTVFLELKKKFQGVVYKRRVSLPLKDAMLYFSTGQKPVTGQIMDEIHYAMLFYGWPAPAMVISYEREAYGWADEAGFRLTFDAAPRARSTALRLEKGSAGSPLLPEGMELMELKSGGAMPLPLSHALNELGIAPASFSKYGTAYTRSLAARLPQPTISTKGVLEYVSNL